VVLAPVSGCPLSTLRACARGGGFWRPPRWSPAPHRRHPPAGEYAAAAPPADGAGAPDRTPSRPPHQGAARVRAGAEVVLRRRRRARAAAPSTADQCGRGGAAGAGAERHTDVGDARLTFCAMWAITSEYGMGGGSTPAAVVSLVRSPRASSARRRWRMGDCSGLPWWPPSGAREKGVDKRQ